MDRITLMWTDLAGRLRDIWEVQNRTARTVTIGVIAVVVSGLAALSTLYIGHKPSYDVLFAGLSADDAVAVTQRLKDDKIDYHTQQIGNSTTIYVPSSVVAEERVQVAGSGLLKNGGTGYELFDKTNFGMTEFQEKIAKTRATEGELQRTINNLDPAARVHIAAPDTGLYSSTQQPTTASIAIKTKAGQSLSPQEVRGITMLVANAVAGSNRRTSRSSIKTAPCSFRVRPPPIPRTAAGRAQDNARSAAPGSVTNRTCKTPPVNTDSSGFGGQARSAPTISYAARILALMPADAVGQILNNLPAPYAAALTQEHPELRR